LARAKKRELTEGELRLDLRRAVVRAQLALLKDDATRLQAIPTPMPMSREDILRIRKELRVSQKVFARLLNVSIKTVQSWEQGTREPSDATLKLLLIADRYPNVLLDVVIDY
jgi:putative transcriptional regulator